MPTKFLQTNQLALKNERLARRDGADACFIRDSSALQHGMQHQDVPPVLLHL